MQHVRSTRIPQRQAVSVIAKIKTGRWRKRILHQARPGYLAQRRGIHDFIPCSGLRHTAGPFGVYSWLQQQDLNL